MRHPLAVFHLVGLLWASAPELPEVKVARADLERLPGTYENEEMGMALKVDLREDGLVISVLRGGPPFPSVRLQRPPARAGRSPDDHREPRGNPGQRRLSRAPSRNVLGPSVSVTQLPVPVPSTFARSRT